SGDKRAVRLCSGTPVDLVDADGILEAFGGEFAAVGEEEAFAGAEAADGVSDEDLAAAGFGGDTGGEDDGRAEEVAVLLDRLAGVESDTNVQRLALALAE